MAARKMKSFPKKTQTSPLLVCQLSGISLTTQPQTNIFQETRISKTETWKRRIYIIEFITETK
jgi:hypothetical protein